MIKDTHTNAGQKAILPKASGVYSFGEGNVPKVSLLGRPNVGKSTLFNRLIHSNRAITHNMPGVTRDRMEGWVKRSTGESFIIIDTGGITLDAHAASVEGPAGIRGFEQEILNQARAAVSESAVLCLVVDGRDGLTPLDAHLAEFLRKQDKPLLLLVNKIDGPDKAELLCSEFHALGFEVLPCSAEHGFNVDALQKKIESLLPADTALTRPEPTETVSAEEVLADTLQEGTPDSPLRLALLGRPNVGKSSLVNALSRSERMIVSSVPGTTRDSVDVPMEIDGAYCIFVDSAGVRRKSRVDGSVESFSVNSSLKTSSKAQLTLLVLDGLEGLTQQDMRLLELLDGRKIPFIVLVNKSDLMKPQDLKEIEKKYRKELSYCQHIPLLMVSAQNRHNLRKIIPLTKSILAESRFRAGTGLLNRYLEQLLQQRQPPLVKQRRAKIYYMTQAESTPPTFVFFVSDIERIPDSYSRYLERALRKILGLKHAPIRIHFRQTGDRHADSK
ncbi:MAG: ribosome biogenesis GTPase Der [Deltaproteobacteria bacterium]|jgi:GTP-binding protein|nr:ribosome biogenesis GTPase Der [Deltaproteobacteria bacterium]